MRKRSSLQKRFLLRLTSGWKDLIALSLVQASEGTHFFWWFCYCFLAKLYNLLLNYALSFKSFNDIFKFSTFWLTCLRKWDFSYWFGKWDSESTLLFSFFMLTAEWMKVKSFFTVVLLPHWGRKPHFCCTRQSIVLKITIHVHFSLFFSGWES